MSTHTVFLLNPQQNLAFRHCSNFVSTTKYSYLSFIPKSIFFQFCRLANLYFLATAILQSIPGLSPINPFTAIAPLLLVLLVAMTKEAIEDIVIPIQARRKNDNRVNHCKCLKWEKKWVEREWQDLVPGDLVKVLDKQEFPADLVLFCSSEENGDCKVQTSNLDGEQNLKTKQALDETMKMFREDRMCEDGEFTAKIEVNPPCYGLSTFSGKLEAEDQHWIDHKQLLLRVISRQGSNLKNTEFVIGMVVYAGHQSKIMMNQKQTPYKQSQFEMILNRIVVFQLVIQTALCIFLAISGTAFATNSMHYLFTASEGQSNGYIGSTTYFAFFLLLNSLIPISLIVNLEMVKFVQTFFVQWDLKMYSADQDQPAKVQSLSILEELGSVDYIFCDKTGTLTSNCMEFKGCNIAGKTYMWDDKIERENMSTFRRFIDKSSENGSEIINEYTLGEDSEQISQIELSGKAFNRQSDFIAEFFTAILLCNDVVTDRFHPENMYLSSSPDEVALILAAKSAGFEFLSRSHSGIHTKISGRPKFFEVLAINDFSAERKRMSVLVKHPDDGSIRLYIKGADEAIIRLLDEALELPYMDRTNQALRRFAEEGLRTLDVGFKVVGECDDWLQRFKNAKAKYGDEQKLSLENLAEEIEQDVCLLGITAVEDKLQKSVPKAIKEFTKADIKVWMITGDKLETAENIALSCNLLNRHWHNFEIRSSENVSSKLKSISDELLLSTKKPELSDLGLIIEGDALAIAIEKHKEMLYSVCKAAKGVVCCRANPKQKAKVVNFVREMDKTAKTLAIGDGGNDTSMIQTAHVGVGIYGKEGHQAADSSDFAISEFRFLRHLIFVHGRWNSRRIGYFILYFFYKNLTFTLVQGYFAFFSGFSAQTVWDDWYLLLFNSAITAAGISCYGLWDQDLNYKLDPAVKGFWPLLYKANRSSLPLTLSKYFYYMFWGLFCSVTVFIVCTNSFSQITDSKGHTEVFWDMSTCMYTSIVLILGLVLIFKMKNWSWVQHAVIWGLGFLLYCPVFMFVYDQVPKTYVYANTADFLSLNTFWSSCWLCVAICAVPFLFIQLYSELFHPSASDLVFQHRFRPKFPKENEATLNSTPKNRKKKVSK
jgi:phospholipid-transporting ATPase